MNNYYYTLAWAKDESTDHDCRWHVDAQLELPEKYQNNKYYWYFAFNHPYLAFMFHPLLDCIADPLTIYKCKCGGRFRYLSKLWFECTNQKLIEKLDIPNINLIEIITYGVLCTKRVYSNDKWDIWANNWLNGVDRKSKSASLIYLDYTGIKQNINYSDPSCAKDAMLSAWSVTHAASLMNESSHFAVVSGISSAAKAAFGANINLNLFDIMNEWLDLIGKSKCK